MYYEREKHKRLQIPGKSQSVSLVPDFYFGDHPPWRPWPRQPEQSFQLQEVLLP